MIYLIKCHLDDGGSITGTVREVWRGLRIPECNRRRIIRNVILGKQIWVNGAICGISFMCIEREALNR